MNIYYLGLKEKTVQYSNFFQNAVLVADSTTSKNYTYKKLYGKNVDYNQLENFKKISKFYDKCIKRILKEDKNAKFMLYNQASKCYMQMKKCLVCTNNIKIIDQLNNKPISRKLLENEANLLNYKYVKGKAITYNKLENLFNKKNRRYVVQQPVGFGGLGTYILDKQNEYSILPLLHKNLVYSVSEYVENAFPINNTFIISNNYILLFNGSQQFIEENNELVYDGWNFDAYKKIKVAVRNKIKNQTIKIVKRLQSLGYRGIGGVDYIVKQNHVYFMEINPRFQASSEELDKKLIENKLPSIFEINYLSFYDEKKFIKVSKKIESLIKD